MKRDANIELLRVILMLGVCMVHAFAVVRPPSIWLRGVVACSVDAFVFISGYYGIRFSLRKLGALYMTGLVSCAMGALVGGIVLGTDFLIGHGGYWVVVRDFLTKHCWFLHSYAVLMIFAPLINTAMNNCTRKEALKIGLPIVGLVFIWSWGTTACGSWRLHLPTVPGFGSLSPLTLIGIYIVARLYQLFALQKHIKVWWVVMVFLTLPWLSGCGYGGYNGPIVLVLAIGLFTLFKNMRLSSDSFIVCNKKWQYVIPSLFACYLITDTPAGRQIMHAVCDNKLENWCGKGVLCAIVLGVGTFVVGLILDIPRRLAVGLIDMYVQRSKANICSNE